MIRTMALCQRFNGQELSWLRVMPVQRMEFPVLHTRGSLKDIRQRDFATGLADRRADPWLRFSWITSPATS